MNLCEEGEGDCNSDLECAGLLECGNTNCAMDGGLWDSGDDCCQARCTADRPCKHGQVRGRERATANRLSILFDRDLASQTETAPEEGWILSAGTTVLIKTSSHHTSTLIILGHGVLMTHTCKVTQPTMWA